MNTFTTNQKEQLAVHMRNRFIGGDVQGYELAITLIVMAIREQIDESDIEPLLTQVLVGSKIGVTVALDKAYKLIDAGAIASILGGADE